MHPTDDWKDLNSKFVLQVLRDYHVTKDMQYLSEMFPTVLVSDNNSIILFVAVDMMSLISTVAVTDSYEEVSGV